MSRHCKPRQFTYFNLYFDKDSLLSLLFFVLPLTHGAQDLEGLNLVRCETRNMFGLCGDILPQDSLLYKSFDAKRASMGQ